MFFFFFVVVVFCFISKTVERGIARVVFWITRRERNVIWINSNDALFVRGEERDEFKEITYRITDSREHIHGKSVPGIFN